MQAGSYLVRERVNLNSVRGGGDLLEFEVDGPKIATVKAGSPVRMELEGLDATFVAGQPATVYAVAYDQYNNPVFDVFGFIVEITMIGEAWTQELDTVISFDNQTARYSIVFTAPHSPLRGTYTLLVSATDLGTPLTTTPEIPTFRPQPSPWRQVLVDGGDSPPLTHRFEHTSVMYRGDMYVFGGALFDKTYLSHMVVLEGADGHVNRDSFAYVKDIVLNSSLMYDGAPVVEVVINTRELIAAGRMSIRCTDILFKAPSIGESLEFYVDPFPGCNNIQTLVYVKLPEGALANTTSLTITMAYGNAYVIENAYSSPKSLFAFHDSFEEDAIDPRWTAVGSCSMEPLDEPVHTLNHSFAYSGKGSLYVREGQRGALAALLPEKLDRFHLRAWFWDSDHLLSAHFVSPDFEACGATANSDTTLARPNNLFARVTALGTYTMSSRMKYCIGAPWQSVPDDAPRRAAQWRRLEVFSSPEAGMTAMVDGVVVKTAPAVTASRVIIAAGLSVDIAAGAYLEGAHAHWDDISLAAWYPGINATARRMEDDEMVDIVESRGWYSVDTAGSQPPPPRYSHTAVVWGDKMWIFGGERSAYAFNDLWAFDFVSSRWSHVVPKGEELPAPRYDHSAAVLVNGGGVECMVIYGGRNGHQFLSDIWEYCFAAGEWRKVADVTIVSGRFGHAAAAVPGTSAMYVFGGYTDTGFSMDFFKCEAGSCVDITHGCPTTSANEGVAEFVGITPRYGHSMLVTANGKALMMYGGSNLESKDGLPGVYRFDIDACFWEKLNVDGSDPSRYEHVAAVSYGGIIVHGGHSAGTYLNSLSFLPAS